MSDHLRDDGIDRFSFQLGMINCFAEMVACGVKNLAISPPLLPADYEAVAPLSDTIVAGFAIESYRETSLLVTDLQSAEFTRGKWSILYYRERKVLEAYLSLKSRQAELIGANRYGADARRDISTAFMELLSYPPEVIEAKLAGSHPDPFLLIES